MGSGGRGGCVYNYYYYYYSYFHSLINLVCSLFSPYLHSRISSSLVLSWWGGSCVYSYYAFYQAGSFYQVKSLDLPWSKDRLEGILLDLRIPGDTFTYCPLGIFSLHQEYNLFCSSLSFYQDYNLSYFFFLELAPIYLGSGPSYTVFGILSHLWRVYPLLKDFLVFSYLPYSLFWSHIHIHLCSTLGPLSLFLYFFVLGSLPSLAVLFLFLCLFYQRGSYLFLFHCCKYMCVCV